MFKVNGKVVLIFVILFFDFLYAMMCQVVEAILSEIVAMYGAARPMHDLAFEATKCFESGPSLTGEAR
jgi:hypothetical protein